MLIQITESSNPQQFRIRVGSTAGLSKAPNTSKCTPKYLFDMLKNKVIKQYLCNLCSTIALDFRVDSSFKIFQIGFYTNSESGGENV